MSGPNLKTQASHTPAPWSVIPQGNGDNLIALRFNTGFRVVAMVFKREGSVEQDEANARLIVHSPTLFTAAKKAIELLIAGNKDEAIAVLSFAVGKAEGRV